MDATETAARGSSAAIVQPYLYENARAPVRLLIVEHKTDSAEAKVVSTLLSAMQGTASGDPMQSVMVVQFGHESLPDGERLRAITGVDLLSVDVGGSLGVPQPRRRKVALMSRLARALPSIVLRARTFRPDVIYTSQQRWDVRVGTLLAALLRRPHVIHLHYVLGRWLGRDVLWRLRRCDRVICISEFIRNKAIKAGIPAERLTVIRNALPPESVATSTSRTDARAALCAELGMPGTDTLLGMVARLTPEKGQLELVQAMAPLLAPKDAAAQLLLVGSETYPELGYARRVRQLAEMLGVSGRVHWLGYRSDIPELLRAFDIFAHPTFEEPCGLAVIEALLAGLPCVVWREGGPAESVVDGETGFLVDTGNIEALTAALERLCADPALRASMRAAASASTDRVGDVGAAARAFQVAISQAARSCSRPRRAGHRRVAPHMSG